MAEGAGPVVSCPARRPPVGSPKSPDRPDGVRAWLERTCAAQGVPVKITDPRVIGEVVAILKSGSHRGTSPVRMEHVPPERQHGSK
jgi:hypothetical protein